MKILFLAISDQQHHPLNKYRDLHCNFDFRSWEAGLRSLYADIHILDYYASFVSDGPLGMEKHVYESVRKNNIQLLIVPNLYYELAPTFLNELRNLGCKSLVAFFDDSIRFEETNSFYLSSFDYYLTHESVVSKGLYKPYGIDAKFFPNLPSHSFYKEIIQSFDKTNFEATDDVVFVGAKIADRAVFVNYLKDKNINISVYGNGWDAGMLSTEKMLSAYSSSKICLNFIKAIDDSGRVQLKGRLFEIIMAGGFVLSEHSDELADYFEFGREIDTFRSPRELLDKVRFYLKIVTSERKWPNGQETKPRNVTHLNPTGCGIFSDIRNGDIKTSYPNRGYKVPDTAIISFLNWNLSFIYGRFMLGQYGLAHEQYKFCQRELNYLACNISANEVFLNIAVRKFIQATARRIFSSNQLFRIRQKYSRSRGLVANRAFAKRVLPKINQIRTSLMLDGDSLFHDVSNKISEFINQQKVPGKDFEYLYSKSTNQPTLYSSAYACMTLSLLGRLNYMKTDQKLRWIEYFDSFQNDGDGLFYDPVVDSALFRTADWWGRRHLALHMINAYTDLGGKPRYPFHFLKEYYDHRRIKAWLDGFNWSSYITCVEDFDNKIMNIGCLLQYQRDTWNDEQAGSAVAYLQKYLVDIINPETGMWGRFDVQDPDQRSRVVQFTYHLLPLFFHDNIGIKDPDKVVQILLATQNKLGGFGVKLNSSACEDIDSIDILIRLSPLAPASKVEIDAALLKALSWVLCNQVDDGGFVFRLDEPFEYGHPETSSETNQGAMLATWFRTLSLAHLMNYLDLSNEFIITSCPGYEC